MQMSLEHEPTSLLSPLSPAYLHSSQAKNIVPTAGLPSVFSGSQSSEAPKPRHSSEDMFSPVEQLQVIAEFLDTTSRLSDEQLRWLSFMESWHSPEEHSLLDAKVDETIAANVEALVVAMLELHDQGTPIKIGHPQTGESVLIKGLCYSVDLRSYQIGIDGPDPSSKTFVPLSQIDRLHL
ncbi:MAG: hypothetical protein ABI602_02400 [Candidatus Saccharibacteria bacterium]